MHVYKCTYIVKFSCPLFKNKFNAINNFDIIVDQLFPFFNVL